MNEMAIQCERRIDKVILKNRIKMESDGTKMKRWSKQSIWIKLLL